VLEIDKLIVAKMKSKQNMCFTNLKQTKTSTF